MKAKRYWSTHRPISIGCYPKGYEVINIVNFDRRTEVPEIGNRLAFGYIDFERDLPAEEQRHYDLMPAAKPKDPRLDGAARTLARALDRGDEEAFDRILAKALMLGIAEEDELLDEAVRLMQV